MSGGARIQTQACVTPSLRRRVGVGEGHGNQPVTPLLRPSECPCGQQATLLKDLRRLLHAHLLYSQGPWLSGPGFKCPLSSTQLNLYTHLFLGLQLEYPAASSLGIFTGTQLRPPQVSRSQTRLLIPLKPAPPTVIPVQ